MEHAASVFAFDLRGRKQSIFSTLLTDKVISSHATFLPVMDRNAVIESFGGGEVSVRKLICKIYIGYINSTFC